MRALIVLSLFLGSACSKGEADIPVACAVAIDCCQVVGGDADPLA